MSGQRGRSAVAADQRSIHPRLAGVPWWAAVLTAVTATAIGFAYDAGAGNHELSRVFSSLYVLGCVVAVLTVQQSGVFTAVIQPPLILFFAVPGAYWLFHGAAIAGLKNILINCGYPLIERFPLMLMTSAAVLLIGMIRWYLGWGARSAAVDGAEPATGIAARLASLWPRRSGGDEDRDDVKAPARSARRPRAERPAHTTRARRDAPANRAAGATGRPAATRTRHARSARDEADRPSSERPRRPRPDAERDGSPEPRRRPREPRDGYRDPRPRREAPVRRSRIEAYDTRESDTRESYDSPEPRRRRPANGTGATHHPISQVRYRDETRHDEPRARRPREQT